MSVLDDPLFWIVLVQWTIAAPVATLVARPVPRRGPLAWRSIAAGFVMVAAFAVVLVLPLMLFGRLPVTADDLPAYRAGALIGAIVSILLVRRIRAGERAPRNRV
jgi:hypothetical protein